MDTACSASLAYNTICAHALKLNPDRLAFFSSTKGEDDLAASAAATLAFLAGGGKTRALMRSRDRSQSSLGSPDSWPQSLRSVVGLMLHSKFPMFVACGAELSFLYNDAYAEILGAKHPAALGRPFHDIWAEIWDDIEPIIEQALQGNATYHENLPLTVSRKGYDEDAWFTFSYSPVRDESGQIAGMFCAVTETTEQMLAERHRAEEHDRLRHLFQQAPGIIAVLRGPQHVFDIANDAYLQLVGHRHIHGKPVGIFVEGSDVTEAVRAHQALRESVQRLRQLANTIPQLAWMADAEGAIHWYNDRFYEYTGMTFEQMKEWGWQNVIDPAMLSDVIQIWKEALATGKAMQMTFPIRGAAARCSRQYRAVVRHHYRCHAA
jgi:PAS domain-containing protein